MKKKTLKLSAAVRCGTETWGLTSAQDTAKGKRLLQAGLGRKEGSRRALRVPGRGGDAAPPEPAGAAGRGRGVSVRAGGAGATGERLWCDPSSSLTCAAPMAADAAADAAADPGAAAAAGGERVARSPGAPLASAPRDGSALS